MSHDNRFVVCQWSGEGYVKCIPRVWARSPRVCATYPGKATELARTEKQRKREAGA